MKSRQVLLASRPAGAPTPGNFRLVEVDVPEPGPGEILVRNIYMSVDPVHARADERAADLRAALARSASRPTGARWARW